MSEPHVVSEPSNYVYIVKDGRARYDLSKALVLEVLDELNAERALNKYLREYRNPGIDSVLVRYVANGNSLHSPKIIDSWEDLVEELGLAIAEDVMQNLDKARQN